MVAYNAQVMRERRSRLPYVDAQTGIAQSDSYNWKKQSERQKGILPGAQSGVLYMHSFCRALIIVGNN